MTDLPDLVSPPLAFIWDVREVELSDDDYEGMDWSAVAVYADGAAGRLTVIKQDGSRRDVAFRGGDFYISGGNAIFLQGPDHPNHGWFIWPTGQDPE